MISERILVLWVSKWRMEDTPGSGVWREGFSVNYVSESEPEETDRGRGVRLYKFSLPMEQYSNVRQVPGIYTIQSKKQPGANGKAEYRPQSIAFVRAVNLGLADFDAGLLKFVDVPGLEGAEPASPAGVNGRRS